MTSAPLLILLALAAPPEVKVKTLAGETLAGRLASLATSGIELQTAAGQQPIAAAELAWVDFSTPSAVAKPAVWIELRDGSRLNALMLSSTGGKAQIDLTSGQQVELPARAIHTVRFRQQETPELAAQWREIAYSKPAGDVLVIRKTSMRTVERGDAEPTTVTEQSLDQLEGTILGIGPASVRFEFDKEQIEVKLEKLEGIVFFQRGQSEYSAAACRATDSGGSSWLLRDVKLAGDEIAATLVGGGDVKLARAALARLDFSVGNVAYLADLKPDSGDGELAVSLQPAAMTFKFGRIFQVRDAPPLGADAFRIAGQQFDSGLSLHSPVALVYRVPAGFRWLRAVAGVDDSIASPGRFELVILGDGRELLRHAFSGDQRREAVPIELDVSNVRRVTIRLDPAQGQDLGDQLDLCEARFTK